MLKTSLTSTETECSLHEPLRDSLDSIVKCTWRFPVAEFNGSIGRGNPTGGHDKHEEYHENDCEAFDEGHVVLDISVDLDVEYIA